LTFRLGKQPKNGSVTIDPRTGAFTYTPDLRRNRGTDDTRFTFIVNDGQADSRPGTVNIDLDKKR